MKPRFRFRPARYFRAMSAVEEIKAEIEKLTPGQLEKVQAFLAELRTEQERRLARANALMGKYKGLCSSVDDFLRRKHEAGDRW